MTEFIDGTAKGKTLSLVELEKQIEALTEKYNSIPLIQTGKIDNIAQDKNSGSAQQITFEKTFKTPPSIFVGRKDGKNNWSWLKFMVSSVTTSGALIHYWNDTGENAFTGIFWLAIGERG